MNLPDECGKELLAHELIDKSVVIVGVDNRPQMFTMWVSSITPTTVKFWADEIHFGLLVFRRPDGTLQEESGRQVHVFEWNKGACKEYQ